MNITITHNDNGSITISTIYNGIRVHQLYIGYTERQAETMFHTWVIQNG